MTITGVTRETTKKDVGPRFSLPALRYLLDHPTEHVPVEIPCGFHVDTSGPRGSRKEVNTMWVGSFPSHHYPHATLVSGPNGQRKVTKDITRLGSLKESENFKGYLRIKVDIDDLIFVALEQEYTSYVVVMRVDGFKPSNRPYRNIMICEPLVVEKYDRPDMCTFYNHDPKGYYLNGIKEDTYNNLTDQVKRNALALGCWWNYNVEHLEGLGVNYASQVERIPTIGEPVMVAPLGIYKWLRRASVEYHRTTKKRFKEEGISQPTFFFSRTPVKVGYTIPVNSTLDGLLPEVWITLNVPFCKQIVTRVTEYNFNLMMVEPNLVYRTREFRAFYEAVQFKLNQTKNIYLETNLIYRA